MKHKQSSNGQNGTDDDASMHQKATKGSIYTPRPSEAEQRREAADRARERRMRRGGGLGPVLTVKARAMQERGWNRTSAVRSNSTVALSRLNQRRWQTVFLEHFRKHAIIGAAAEAAGVNRKRVERERGRNPKFLALYNDALERANEIVDGEILKRAIVGEPEPIWMKSDIYGAPDKKGNQQLLRKNQPVKVETLFKKSDRMLEMLARARMPHKYRENVTTELTGPGGSPLQPMIAPTQVQIIIPSNSRDLPAVQIDGVEPKPGLVDMPPQNAIPEDSGNA